MVRYEKRAQNFHALWKCHFPGISSFTNTEALQTPSFWGFIKVSVISIIGCHWPAAAAAKSLQLCSTLWDPTDGSPPGSSVPGILQARILEWVAIAFSWHWPQAINSTSQPSSLLRDWEWGWMFQPSIHVIGSIVNQPSSLDEVPKSPD